MSPRAEYLSQASSICFASREVVATTDGRSQLSLKETGSWACTGRDAGHHRLHEYRTSHWSPPRTAPRRAGFNVTSPEGGKHPQPTRERTTFPAHQGDHLMSTHPFALHFAAMCRFDDAGTGRAAQLALLSRNGNDIVEALVNNDGIHPDAVSHLLSSKLPAKAASALIMQFSSRAQVDAFLDNERRDSVIAKAVPHLDDKQALRALHIGGNKTRDAIVRARHLTDQTRIDAAGNGPVDIVAAAYLLGDISDPTVINDDTAWTTLIAATMPAKPSAQLRSALQWVFHKRPALLANIDGSSPFPMLSAAAGSIDLDLNSVHTLVDAVVEAAKNGNRWPLLAAIANPRFDAETFRSHLDDLDETARMSALEQIHWRRGRSQIVGSYADVHVELLPWLTKRAYSSENSPARPVELIKLAEHPLLLDAHRQLVAELIEARDHFQVFAPGINAALQQLADLHEACESSCDARQLLKTHNAASHHYGHNDLNGLMDEKLTESMMSSWIGNAHYYEIRGFCLRTEQCLGSDQQRWDTLWALLDQLDPSTTIGELIELSAKL